MEEMEENRTFFQKTMINFMRYKWIYFLISGLVLIPGVFSLVAWGLKPSIDFTGGTLIEVKSENLKGQNDLEKIKTIFSQNKVEVINIQPSGDKSYLLKMKVVTPEQNENIKKSLEKEIGKIEEPRYETIGPTLGRELLEKTFIAAILAIIGILSYVAYAFKNLKFGVSAVLALFHDLLVVVGIFSLLGHFRGIEVDSLFVTAVLTAMSFSVHDTIVVFDRIRESLKKNPGVDFEALTNRALTETMGRSLNNSLTIVFMLLALMLLGGQTIKWFVFALLIGTISGTYSSPFVATPILVLWQKWEEKRKQQKS